MMRILVVIYNRVYPTHSHTPRQIKSVHRLSARQITCRFPRLNESNGFVANGDPSHTSFEPDQPMGNGKGHQKRSASPNAASPRMSIVTSDTT